MCCFPISPVAYHLLTNICLTWWKIVTQDHSKNKINFISLVNEQVMFRWQHSLTYVEMQQKSWMGIGGGEKITLCVYTRRQRLRSRWDEELTSSTNSWMVKKKILSNIIQLVKAYIALKWLFRERERAPASPSLHTIVLKN